MNESVEPRVLKDRGEAGFERKKSQAVFSWLFLILMSLISFPECFFTKMCPMSWQLFLTLCHIFENAWFFDGCWSVQRSLESSEAGVIMVEKGSAAVGGKFVDLTLHEIVSYKTGASKEYESIFGRSDITFCKLPQSAVRSTLCTR